MNGKKKSIKAKHIVSLLTALIMIITLSSCGRLNELMEGWKDEFDGLIDQIENEENPSPANAQKGKYDFTSKDVNGKTVRLSDYPDAKVVMLNFWEPWCGPCLREMPDLARLYEAYKDKGFLIVGVFSAADMDGDVKQIISEYGIGYPLVRQQGELAAFQTKYVPATIFVDGEGNLLSDEPVVGSQDYAAWEKLVKKYLG